MTLKENSVFGDYAILFNLKSNIIFRTKSDSQEADDDGCTTGFMCCRKDVVESLCELYPKTAE